MDINEAKVENLATWLYDDFHSVSIKGAAEIATTVVAELTSLLEDAGGLVCAISVKQILASDMPVSALFKVMSDMLRTSLSGADDSVWPRFCGNQGALEAYEYFRACVEVVVERFEKRVFFFLKDFDACLSLGDLDRLEILNKCMDLVDDEDEDFALGMVFVTQKDIFEIQKGMGLIGSTLNDRIADYVEEF